MKTGSYPFSDGSIYHFRIIDEVYQEKLENPLDGETLEDLASKLKEAFEFFINTGKLTQEEVDNYYSKTGLLNVSNKGTEAEAS